MWKNINNSPYYLTFSSEKGYQICITDYVNLWVTFATKKTFLNELKETNKMLKLTEENEYIQKALKVLSNPQQLKKHTIEKIDKGEVLHVSMTVLIGYPYTISMDLVKGSETLFYEKLTLPLLKTIKDLKKSQTELRTLLKKKDKEIDEYKEEGGEIVLRHLKTKAYNDEEHMSEHKQYEEIFGEGNNEITCLKEIVPELPQKSSVKIEPEEDPLATVTIKVEPPAVCEEDQVPKITEDVSCKQEVKAETTPTHSPRKKNKKLSY